MSKKILKRSLALGALMAFVITGNALAANMVNQTQANEINENTVNYAVDGAITANESDIVISGNRDVTVLTVKGGDVSTHNLFGNDHTGSGGAYPLLDTINVGVGGCYYKNNYETETIHIRNLKELQVEGKYSLAAGHDVNFVIGNPNHQNANQHKPKSKIFIENTVENVILNSESTGVYVGGENALVQVESKNLTINSGSIAVNGNAMGTINLGTKENKIENIVIKQTNSSGIHASGNSNINIFANNFEMTTKGYGISSRSGNVRLGSSDCVINKVSIIASATDDVAAVQVRETNNVEIYGNDVTIRNIEGGSAVRSYASGKYNSDGTSMYSPGNITIVANRQLEIKGDIVNTNDGGSILSINDGLDDALVTIDGDIINKGAKESVVITTINLGTTGSSLTGAVRDDVNGVTLNLNKGIWNVKDKSKVDTIKGNGATIKVNKLEDSYVTINNGENAINFNFVGSKEVTDELNGNNLAESMDKVKDTVKGISFANYSFEEGTALGEIEAYQENGEWKITEYTNVTNSNISDVVAHGLMAWRSEMNDMNKRLGELRNANGEHGVWVRMVRGESEYEAVKNQYNTYQLGYDEKLSVDKSWTVGMALTYTDGESGFNGGNAENQHKGFAVYGSKLNADGSFIDLIAKYARLDHDIEVGTEKGDYDANGYSVSAEYGKRFQQGNGLWIEPQVELTYGQVGSADYMIGKNRAIVQEGMESLVGRIGFSLGKDIKDGNVYARASYLYDFEGETEASYTDTVGNRRYINDDLGGGWWEVGVGANINLSKATYIYADVEKTFGGEVDTNWQWNLGVRYSF